MNYLEINSKWQRDNCCPSCVFSLRSSKCVGSLVKRPHHLTSYWRIRHQSTYVFAHRILWILDNQTCIDSGFEIDHIDRNGLNNLETNLRLLKSSEQKFNTGSRRNSTSNYKGVSWSKTKLKWRAQIQVNFRKIHIGYFNTELEAATAYDAYVKECAPSCAFLNFV